MKKGLSHSGSLVAKVGFLSLVVSLFLGANLSTVSALGVHKNTFRNSFLLFPSEDAVSELKTNLRYISAEPYTSPSGDLILVIGKFINIILGLVGVVLFVLILVAGGMWMTAAGNEDRVKNAQKIIRQAVVGVVVIVLAFALSNFVIMLLENSGALTEPTTK